MLCLYFDCCFLCSAAVWGHNWRAASRGVLVAAPKLGMVQCLAVEAMAEQKLEHEATARPTLAKCLQLSETALPRTGSRELGMGWQDVLIARLLTKEAKALIGDPAAAGGKP